MALLKFQIALALMIFLPAWSLWFWEAWLYLGLFFLCAFVTTTYFLEHDPGLIERRLNVGPMAEPERSQKRILTAASASMTATYLVAGFDRHFGWSRPLPTALILLADVLVVLGFVIMFVTFQANTHASSVVEVRDGQGVVSTGPYGWVRHPMYVGGIVLFVATPIALGSLWALIPAAAVVATVVFRLIDEERYLTQRLPGYVDYQVRVRYRLIPGVW